MGRGRALLAFVALALAGGAAGVASLWDRATLLAPDATPILSDRHGAFLGQIGNVGEASGPRRLDYGYWPLAQVPPRVAAATLALEDRRFGLHPGVDPAAILRAAWQNGRRGRRVSGASTLAMQVARMQDPAPRGLGSKLREAATALLLTARYGREGVLRHYLRIVPYGNGSHGIAHAARFYFDKPVEDLSWAEIALLSAIPQSPTALNPLRPDGLARAVRRGHAALDQLGREGVVAGPDLALAHAQLAALRMPARPRRPEALHALVRFEAMRRDGHLVPPDPSDPRLTTSIDLAIESRVAAQTRRFLAAWRPMGAEQAAVMVVARGSREVLAALGSADYADRRAGAIDFTRTPRSPGSTLKPFIYGLALDRGVIRPSDTLADLPEGASGIGNADGLFLGPMLPRQALANSRNIPATNLVRTLGLETTFRHLRALGLHDLDMPASTFGLSMAIGSVPTTLEALVRAYGALAEDGVIADLSWQAGARAGEGRRVMSRDAARLVTSFLADPLARLPGFPRYGATEYPFPVALKTGTSQGYRDAWLVGWSSRFLVGIWVGRGDAGTTNGLSGGRAAARLARAVLTDLHGLPVGDLVEAPFPAPEGRVPVELCAIGGTRSAGPCGQTLTEWVRPDEMPPLAEVATLAPAGEGARLTIAVPAAHRAWAQAEGFRLPEPAPPGAAGRVALAVAAPEQNARIWRNPEAPAGLDRLVLKASVEPRVPQIVWYVDGEPFRTADPDEPVTWPLAAGTHRFQVRLPFSSEASPSVRIVVD